MMLLPPLPPLSRSALRLPPSPLLHFLVYLCSLLPSIGSSNHHAKPLVRVTMAYSARPIKWMEQILSAARLLPLLPAATAWAYENGCSASDMTIPIAEELAAALHMKDIPARRLINVVQKAILNESLIDDDPIDLCWEISSDLPNDSLDQQQTESDQEPHVSSLPITPPACAPPSPGLAHGQEFMAGSAPRQRTSDDRVRCEVHGKMRSQNNLVTLPCGLVTCMDGHTCQGIRKPRRVAPSSSPPSRRKRARSWSSEEISAHVSGLGRYPQNSRGLHREQDGSFALDDVMDYWGHKAGLSPAAIESAIQEHLFKKPKHGETRLRFSVSQGTDRSDPIMIKVAPPSRP